MCNTPKAERKAKYEDEQRKLWQTAIHETYDEVSQLVDDDEAFRYIMDRIKTRNSMRPGNSVYRRLMVWYGYRAFAGIRKFLDKDGAQTHGLRALLLKVAKNPVYLSRSWFVSAYLADLGITQYDDVADREFDRQVGAGEPTLTEEMVNEDIHVLNEFADVILPAVNQTLLHMQKNPTVTEFPTWQEIHDAIATIAKIWRKYEMLLTQMERPLGNSPITKKDIDIAFP